jgi:hypothetical protein
MKANVGFAASGSKADCAKSLIQNPSSDCCVDNGCRGCACRCQEGSNCRGRRPRSCMCVARTGAETRGIPRMHSGRDR